MNYPCILCGVPTLHIHSAAHRRTTRRSYLGVAPAFATFISRRRYIFPMSVIFHVYQPARRVQSLTDWCANNLISHISYSLFLANSVSATCTRQRVRGPTGSLSFAASRPPCASCAPPRACFPADPSWIQAIARISRLWTGCSAAAARPPGAVAPSRACQPKLRLCSSVTLPSAPPYKTELPVSGLTGV
ncbi:hypothetical protein BC834DRAFT_386277 [Gloeopeniophorella convolvens]|nr:hypothetical protein BC834DRAFT_386277 [Gloeopeniophorella convolvens]